MSGLPVSDLLGLYVGVTLTLLGFGAFFAWWADRDGEAQFRRDAARVALLCWAWPVLLLIAVSVGLRWLWRVAR